MTGVGGKNSVALTGPPPPAGSVAPGFPPPIVVAAAVATDFCVGCAADGRVDARNACKNEDGGVAGTLGAAGGNRSFGVVYVNGSSDGQDEVRTAVNGIEV